MHHERCIDEITFYIQIVSASRRPLHFPRQPNTPKSLDKRMALMPQNLRAGLVDWIERFGKDRMSWEPVDQFWQWYQSIQGKI